MNYPQKYNELNLQNAIDADLGFSIHEAKKVFICLVNDNTSI